MKQDDFNRKLHQVIHNLTLQHSMCFKSKWPYETIQIQYHNGSEVCRLYKNNPTHEGVTNVIKYAWWLDNFGIIQLLNFLRTYDSN